MKNSDRYKAIAVIDTIEDKILQQSLELIAFTGQLYRNEPSSVLLLITGRNIIEECSVLAAEYGFDIAAAEHNSFYYPNPDLLVKTLNKLQEKYKPEIFCLTHTIRNCSAAAAFSADCGMRCITGIESFSVTATGRMFQRSIFNGKLKEEIVVSGQQLAVTVNPGAFQLRQDDTVVEREASVEKIEVDEEVSGYKPVSLSESSDIESSLEEADVIVAAGRGIGKPENLQMVRDIARMFDNAAIGASRPVCDNRWLPYRHQVGVTGKTVSPKLYLALGISGSQQHIAGMKNSQCIVAVNVDPHAAIFSVADYIIVEDINVFMPELLKVYHKKNS
ncbi:MAG TPA: electron transfer flavoprotein subunit alpha/FixB family protein [Spirochaetota bacterium]|nr:electron transfer flavoprotein subunit alpha/FixB family protein [Spirochaetota bacterium]